MKLDMAGWADLPLPVMRADPFFDPAVPWFGMIALSLGFALVCAKILTALPWRRYGVQAGDVCLNAATATAVLMLSILSSVFSEE